MKYIFLSVILTLMLFQKVRASESCHAFYQKEFKHNVAVQRTIEMIPVLGLRHRIQRTIADELKIRQSLTPDQIERRRHAATNAKRLFGQSAAYGVLNYLSDRYLGFWGLFPNIRFINVQKLTTGELEKVAAYENNLTHKQIADFFGVWRPMVQESGRLWNLLFVFYTAFVFVQNPDELAHLKTGLQLASSMLTSQATLNKIQDQSYPEKRIRDLAIENWKKSFKATEGREVDPEKYPEDKFEWDQVHRQIQNAPLNDLRIPFRE